MRNSVQVIRAGPGYLWKQTESAQCCKIYGLCFTSYVISILIIQSMLMFFLFFFIYHPNLHWEARQIEMNNLPRLLI